MIVEYNECLMAEFNQDLNNAMEKNKSYWERKKAEEKEKFEKRLAKKGITKEEYEAQQEAKRIQAKKKRYKKEIDELEDRLAYLKKWIAEHDAD